MTVSKKINASALIAVLFVSSIAISLPENPEGLVKRVVKKDAAVEEVLPVIYAQAGVDSQGNEKLRFASPVKVSDSTTLAYTRSVEGVDDKVVEVKSVYKAIEANGVAQYYDGTQIVSEDPQNDYYWANYLIKFNEDSAYKSKMFTIKLDVDGKQAPFLTTSYDAVELGNSPVVSFVEDGKLLGRSIVESGNAPVYAGLALTENQVWMSNNVIYDTLPVVTENATFEIVNLVEVSGTYDIDLCKLSSSWDIDEVENDTITSIKVGENEVTFTQDGSNINVTGYEFYAKGAYEVTLMGEDSVYVLNATVLESEVNLQEGLGTDFEGYNPTDNAKLYASGNMTNGWKTDNNGNENIGILSGYQGVKLFDDNGNTALKIAGSKEYIYAAMDINNEVNTPGTYRFVFKAKLGPTADKIGNIFFRFFDRASSNKANSLLSTPIYFRETSEPTVLSPLSKDEWVTMEAMFTVTKDLYTTSSYGPTIAEADRNLTIVMATYTYGTETTGTDNHAGNYMLLDDFKVYKAENLKATIGTDFEGYSEETHPELFSEAQFTSQGTGNYYDFTNYPKVSYAKEIIKSNETKAHGLWFADNYGQNAFAMQASYEDLRLTKETDGNVALKVSKGNGTLTRIGLNVDASLLKPGTYMATMKVKSASAETTASGKILFKLNYGTNLFANGNLTDGFYFVGNSSDKASTKYNVFPTDEYTTVSVQFTITEDLTSKNLCAALVVYAPTTGSLLIDDFKIYG